MDDIEPKRLHPLLLPLFGGGFCEWEETDRSMREIMGNDVSGVSGARRFMLDGMG